VRRKKTFLSLRLFSFEGRDEKRKKIASPVVVENKLKKKTKLENPDKGKSQTTIQPTNR
jgi:hypothetical protein